MKHPALLAALLLLALALVSTAVNAAAGGALQPAAGAKGSVQALASFPAAATPAAAAAAPSATRLLISADETTLREEFGVLSAELRELDPESPSGVAKQAELLAVARAIVRVTAPLQLKNVRSTIAGVSSAATAASAATNTAVTAATQTADAHQHGDQTPLSEDPWALDATLPVASETAVAAAAAVPAAPSTAAAAAARSFVEADSESEAFTAAESSACTNKGGTCKATSAGCSGGAFSSGLCTGASNIKCCIKTKTTAAKSACETRGGTCKATSAGCSGGTFSSGLCTGASNIKCCLKSSSAAPAPQSGSSSQCGPYASAGVSSIKGNGNRNFNVVRISKAHLTDKSIYDRTSTAADNTMLKSTACAFNAMHEAAKRAGVTVTINSGFRTLARQQYFWNCYRSKRCNNGNLAAAPGTSNHGIGLAVDLNSSAKGVYSWLSQNAHKFGFVRTVASEKWHWEHRVGWKRAPYT